MGFSHGPGDALRLGWNRRYEEPNQRGRRVWLDPWPARLLFVLILLIVPGSQLLLYPVLWILMPNEATKAQFLPVTEEEQTASAA